MSRPLVEVVRSGFRECVHHGSAVVLSPDGTVLLEIGEVHKPIFPRSSNKPLQAVALVRAGFVPESTDELAITSASHEGQPDHIRLVKRLLARFEVRPNKLLCPAALPSNEIAKVEAIVDGRTPSPLFMNCSGKHAAMLATCVVNDWPLAGYVDADHPLQLAVADTIIDLTGEPETEIGIDGCGVPIVPVSPVNLARAFAGLVRSEPSTPERSVADAIRAHPFLMSGSGKEDLLLMRAVPGLLCKSGADGVFVAALPDGTSLAFKIDDGSERARLPLAAALLKRCGVPWTEDLADLAARPVFGGGVRVGTIRALAF